MDIKTHLYETDFIALALALLTGALWIPVYGWHLEIYKPWVGLVALYLLPVALIVIPVRSQSRRKHWWSLPVTLAFLGLAGLGLLSMVELLLTSIPAPLDILKWHTSHTIRVGQRIVEADKTRNYSVSTGAGEIIVRQVVPLAPGLMLVKTPIAAEQFVVDVDLKPVDDTTFEYQFSSDDDKDFPLKRVSFN